MRNCDSIIIKDVNSITYDIALLALLFVRSAIRLHTGDEYAADLKFSSAINDMRCTFDRVRITMTGRVMAHRNNIGFESERVVANRFIIKWVRHHRRVIALGETKTGMSVPGNFHENVASEGVLYTLFC